MAIYVCVHGGFFGGWIWRTVANMMHAEGHEVFTPTLTGLGERAHLANPQVDLNTHIQDIIGVLECEDLQDVILVGHSYGSMVVTGVAERSPERLTRLVYLDTAIPQDGQSWTDLFGSEVVKLWTDIANKHGDGWRLPLISDPPRIQPHPLKTVLDPLTVKNPMAAKIPRAYIRCTIKPKDSPVAVCWPALDKASENARKQGWWYRELPADHGVMLEMPRELADLLLELA
jgi:pimeloyl-ACP methyl ester carboxylesterase